MTETDLILIYKRFEEIDRELKLLKAEVADMKWYQQHGVTGAVAYSSSRLSLTKDQLGMKLDNDIFNCQDVTPRCIEGGYCKCEDRKNNETNTK